MGEVDYFCWTKCSLERQKKYTCVGSIEPDAQQQHSYLRAEKEIICICGIWNGFHPRSVSMLSFRYLMYALRKHRVAITFECLMSEKGCFT